MHSLISLAIQVLIETLLVSVTQHELNVTFYSLQSVCALFPSDKKKPFSRTIPSMFHGRARFNGFLFGINLALIAPVAHAHPTQLFDPADTMVGQEDRLMTRMSALGMIPKISMCAFAFHFKSVTVAAASISTLNTINQQQSQQHQQVIASHEPKQASSPRLTLVGKISNKVHVIEEGQAPAAHKSAVDFDCSDCVASQEHDALFLLLEVEDNGIGISDEMIGSLFAPFKQAQRRAGGTGLGECVFVSYMPPLILFCLLCYRSVFVGQASGGAGRVLRS